MASKVAKLIPYEAMIYIKANELKKAHNRRLANVRRENAPHVKAFIAMQFAGNPLLKEITTGIWENKRTGRCVMVSDIPNGGPAIPANIVEGVIISRNYFKRRRTTPEGHFIRHYTHISANAATEANLAMLINKANRLKYAP